MTLLLWGRLQSARSTEVDPTEDKNIIQNIKKPKQPIDYIKKR
jgi:hypothetical protein